MDLLKSFECCYGNKKLINESDEYDYSDEVRKRKQERQLIKKNSRNNAPDSEESRIYNGTFFNEKTDPDEALFDTNTNVIRDDEKKIINFVLLILNLEYKWYLRFC